jgi:hypothetical protein
MIQMRNDPIQFPARRDALNIRGIWGYLLLLGGLCGFLDAQTQVSLRTQAKAADLSASGPTKPMQTGAVLPSTCGIGEMFFLTTAPGGSNVYSCFPANVWTGIVSGASLVPGTGAIITTGGGSTSVSVDPAVIPTKAVVQAGTSTVVTLTSISPTALTGTMNPTLSAYSEKQIIEFTWNVNCAGGAMTIAVDGLGAKSLVKPDGAANLGAADCTGGTTSAFTYDGTLGVFKLFSPSPVPNQTVSNCSSATSPAICGSASAGSFVIAPSTTTVTVNTTAVTANSQILLQPDTSLGSKLAVTCNADAAIANFAPIVSARTAGTSFAVTITGSVATSPACYSYVIFN